MRDAGNGAMIRIFFILAELKSQSIQLGKMKFLDDGGERKLADIFLTLFPIVKGAGPGINCSSSDLI